MAEQTIGERIAAAYVPRMDAKDAAAYADEMINKAIADAREEGRREQLTAKDANVAWLKRRIEELTSG